MADPKPVPKVMPMTRSQQVAAPQNFSLRKKEAASFVNDIFSLAIKSFSDSISLMSTPYNASHLAWLRIKLVPCS